MSLISLQPYFPLNKVRQMTYPNFNLGGDNMTNQQNMDQQGNQISKGIKDTAGAAFHAVHNALEKTENAAMKWIKPLMLLTDSLIMLKIRASILLTIPIQEMDYNISSNKAPAKNRWVLYIVVK